jgi:hypothetical protein
LKHYEESIRNEEERCPRKSTDKRECKNAERLEKARRRVEQIRSIIGSIDPANLNSSYTSEASTSSAHAAHQATPNELPPNILLSPETTRLLSSAIAGCLQPCTVINKVLNDVFALIPQVIPLPEDQDGGQASPSAAPTANFEQQTMEVPKQTTATNTSDANTPEPVRQASDEIEALFKEAAKELEKMNEIVKSSNKMETSSTSSSNTGVTQIERIFKNINESAISNATVINAEFDEEEKQPIDMTDSTVLVSTPSKFERSRESSIEVHDVGSFMSDDSRDWTILSIDQEEVVEPPPTPATPSESRIIDPKTGAIPKGKAVDTSSQVDPEEIYASGSKRESIKSVTTETQTAISIISDQQQKQLQDSVQKSIEIVQKSIKSIQKSLEPQQDEQKSDTNSLSNEGAAAAAIPLPAPSPVTPETPTYGFNVNLYPSLHTAPAALEQSKANLMATEQQAKPKFAPAVIVYDPNPKINAAVHTMMQMGFSNEGN